LRRGEILAKKKSGGERGVCVNLVHSHPRDPEEKKKNLKMERGGRKGGAGYTSCSEENRIEGERGTIAGGLNKKRIEGKESKLLPQEEIEHAWGGRIDLNRDWLTEFH